MGSLYPEKGIELFVDSIPEVIKTIPNVKFVIIGTGPLEEKIKNAIKKMNIKNNVNFIGHVKSREEIFKILLECSVGVAPYFVKKNSYTSFGFGAKVIDYMACGLPVIICHWKEIEKLGLGLTINYDSKEMSPSIIKLLTDKTFFMNCHENVLTYVKSHYYKNVYNDAFKKIGFKIN